MRHVRGRTCQFCTFSEVESCVYSHAHKQTQPKVSQPLSYPVKVKRVLGLGHPRIRNVAVWLTMGGSRWQGCPEDSRGQVLIVAGRGLQKVIPSRVRAAWIRLCGARGMCGAAFPVVVGGLAFCPGDACIPSQRGMQTPIKCFRGVVEAKPGVSFPLVLVRVRVLCVIFSDQVKECADFTRQSRLAVVCSVAPFSTDAGAG